MATQQETTDFDLRGAAADIAAEAAPRRRANGDGRLASALGWFSVGLGAAEVAAPGLMARLIGVEDSTDNRELLRAAGLRELTSGVGILTRDERAGWVWARVGGDVMDLALLGGAYASTEAQRRRLAIATAAVAGVTALDVICGRKLSGGWRSEQSLHVRKAITVNRRPDEVYAFWRDFAHFPTFMAHVESVRATGPKRSHWVARGPAGTSFEWDSEIVDDQPGEGLAWRSLEGSDVEHSGFVRFRPAPGSRGTEVTLDFRYDPPAGQVGRFIASLFGEAPEQQWSDDLRRFKQVMETGEISRSEASESLAGMRQPAQPEEEPRRYGAFARGER